jgi:hypothetical protein
MPAFSKRPPDTFTDDTYTQYAKISKADWADLFADLYRESSGEEAASSDEIMRDALRRLEILKAYRKSA